jgi:hypothetical protein
MGAGEGCTGRASTGPQPIEGGERQIFRDRPNLSEVKRWSNTVRRTQTEVDDQADDYSGGYDYAAPKQKQFHHRKERV